MIQISIPPNRELHLSHLCLDLNGTISIGGELVVGVSERLAKLCKHMSIHVITADTNGNAALLLRDMPLSLYQVGKNNQGEEKLHFIQTLGEKNCVCMGNGHNDRLMLRYAGLSIGIIGAEGMAATALAVADIVLPDINNALDLLIFPNRLIATLRD